VLCYDGAALRWETSFEDAVGVIDDSQPDAQPQLFSVRAHDFAYQAESGPLTAPTLYLADAEGNQVIAFDLEAATGAIVARDDFLPLREWGARALVAANSELWFDFEGAQTRWVTVQVYGEYRYATAATLRTPVDFGETDGGPFDSRTPGCVWHRLLLDAALPPGSTLRVRARSSDDPATLVLQDWLAQPTPYQRSDGSELPYADPWIDRRGDDPDNPVPLPGGTGTWELLFQQVAGRYLQLELAVTGPGNDTPLLKELRAWYARFSYPQHYLPAVYAEHDEPSRFLERFLANQEGMFTALEEKIEHSALLLDARTAPVADLPWLAGWFGLAIDPKWTVPQRRFLIKNVDRFYRWRGTPIGLVALLRVFVDGIVDESVFAGGAASAGGIRVVERFITRDVGGPDDGGPADRILPDPLDRARSAAHRFDVLVPSCLDDDGLAMVRRIVENAKPAHTLYRLRRYYALFIAGTARLGVDTELGQGPRFQAITLGATSLLGGYLAAPYPFDQSDRVISDRDRLGSLPAL
jgi:phage tail-like protein